MEDLFLPAKINTLRFPEGKPMNDRTEIHDTKVTTTIILMERGSTILSPVDRGSSLPASAHECTYRT